MIAVNEPALGEREQELVLEAVRSGWVSSAGPFIERFESGWAAYCGARHGIAVANGTVALELALAALDLEPGSEVILPTFTIISCATAVVRNGLAPVLVDADPATWCMDVEQVAARITSRTRAIMPVHMYGHPVDMDPLLALADRHGLAVVEDAAEAHGAEYLAGRSGASPSWRRCGALGTISCFSFYANKLITTGEGGMLLTDDERLAARARSLRNLCFLPGRRFYHEELGFNFRLTNLQAALGVAQLERMDAIVARKRAVGHRYRERLGAIAALEPAPEAAWARSVFWMNGLVLGEPVGFAADELAARLAARQVETRPFFLGLHEQPALHDLGFGRGERYPVAERLARRGLYLPSGVALTDEQLERSCDAVEEILS